MVGEDEAVAWLEGVVFVAWAAFGVHFLEEAFFFEGAEGEIVDVAVVDFGQGFLDGGVGVAAGGDEAEEFSLGGYIHDGTSFLRVLYHGERGREKSPPRERARGGEGCGDAIYRRT